MQGEAEGIVERLWFAERRGDIRREVDSIRSQERQRVREELFSELEAMGWSGDEEIPSGEIEAAINRVVERAALDSLEDSDTREEAGG